MMSEAASETEWLVYAGEILDKELLKEKVQSWCKILTSKDASHEELLEGSKSFHELILAVWSLDTSFAVDAAELVCHTLR